jgi:hypothetical protein
MHGDRGKGYVWKTLGLKLVVKATVAHVSPSMNL